MRLALSPPPGHKGYNWSPRKQIGFPLASPKKFGDVTLSPRKLGSIPMSPRKLGGVPMSPRKLDVRSLNSPLRLAKQEGKDFCFYFNLFTFVLYLPIIISSSVMKFGRKLI